MSGEFWIDPDCWVRFNPSFLASAEADDLLSWSLSDVAWEDKGEYRKLAWYGTFDYNYPGVSHPAVSIPDRLLDICKRVQASSPQEIVHGFDGIRLNYYESGSSFVDFHGDSEPSLLDEYPIAFLSLGAPRVLIFRSSRRSIHPGYAFLLTHGSLLLMGGSIQARWHHGVPVEPLQNSARVSITLRKGADI